MEKMKQSNAPCAMTGTRCFAWIFSEVNRCWAMELRRLADAHVKCWSQQRPPASQIIVAKSVGSTKQTLSYVRCCVEIRPSSCTGRIGYRDGNHRVILASLQVRCFLARVISRHLFTVMHGIRVTLGLHHQHNVTLSCHRQPLTPPHTDRLHSNSSPCLTTFTHLLQSSNFDRLTIYLHLSNIQSIQQCNRFKKHS